MRVGEICTREVICCDKATTCLQAAELMRKHHVGALVVTEGINGERSPVGIVTDRDLVVEIVAPQLAAETITVGDIMQAGLVTATEAEGVYETVERMRTKAVRRLPVVDAKGSLVGVVTLDDMLEILAEQITNLVNVVTRQQKREARTRK